MDAASSYLGKSTHILEGGVFDSTRFIQEPSWQPSPMVGGAMTSMHIHYDEHGGYPGAEVEEDSACSAPVVLGLSAPMS